jgi:hypothetical protein
MQISRSAMRGLQAVVLAAIAGCFCGMAAQTVRNPKLATADLERAREAVKEGGGSGAELVYAARIDAVTKAAFDCLVVVYSTGSTPTKQYYAIVLRDGQSLHLVGDKSGTALPKGDRFLRIGLRHEAEKAPLLRVMGATGESGGDEQQRNLDFRFNGKEFELVDQSVMKISR